MVTVLTAGIRIINAFADDGYHIFDIHKSCVLWYSIATIIDV